MRWWIRFTMPFPAEFSWWGVCVEEEQTCYARNVKFEKRILNIQKL